MKNPFAQIAFTYSGSPWLLFGSALTQTLLALMFFFPERHSVVAPFAGTLCAAVALCYYGGAIYFLTHRAELAANPAKPIFYTAKTMIWIVAFTLVIIAVFTVLVLFLWRS
jgi:hypothetical protein